MVLPCYASALVLLCLGLGQSRPLFPLLQCFMCPTEAFLELAELPCLTVAAGVDRDLNCLETSFPLAGLGLQSPDAGAIVVSSCRAQAHLGLAVVARGWFLFALLSCSRWTKS